MTIKNLFLLFIILVGNLILTGCSNQKVRNCQKIIEMATQIQLKAENNLKSKNLNNIRQVAQSFEQAGQKIEQEKIKDQQLAQYSQSLGQIYQEYGQLTRNFISAFQTKDQEKAILYKNQIQQLSEQQNELVKEINGYCQFQ